MVTLLDENVWLSLKIISDPSSSTSAYVRMHQSKQCMHTRSLYILTMVVEFAVKVCDQTKS